MTVNLKPEYLRKLEILASDKWSVCKGQDPIPQEKMLERLIDSEWRRYSPPAYTSLQGRE